MAIAQFRAEIDSAAGAVSTRQVARQALAFLPFLNNRWRWLRNWLANPPGSKFERSVYVLLFAMLVLMRQPGVVTEGRFWAEEGGIFFEHAWTMPWYEALLMPYAGYLNLIANFGGVLARHIAPLWAAPYISSGLALAVQCIPAVVIVTSRADWLRQRVAMAAALLLIATVLYSYEVNLTSIASHFYLALATGIILALEPRTGASGALQWGVLIIAPLCGPASWALLPLFAARAAIDQSRLRALQAAVLGFGVLLQMIFFFGHFDGRSIGISPSLFGAVVLAKHVITPTLRIAWANSVILSFVHSFTENGGPLWPLAIVITISAVVIIALARFTNKAPFWLFCAGVAIALIGYSGAYGQKTDIVSVLCGSRYAMVPQLLFSLCLLSWCMLHRSSVRFWSGCAVAWLLVIGILDYRVAQSGPPWQPEVAKWEQDNSYVLKIWPPGFTMTLPR